MYGQPFMFTFKGQKTFKTNIGAAATTLIVISVVSYLIFKLRIMFCMILFDQSIYQQNLTIKLRDFKLGFDLAFGGYSDLDPKYGSIIATHNVKQRFKNETTGLLEAKMVYEPLELVRCGLQHFNYEKKNESAYEDVANLLCIKEKKYLSLGGAWTTNRLEEIQIVMKPCENKTDSKTICASQSEILKYFSTVDFQVRFVNQYFDFNDIQDPIKKFIEDRYFIPVQTNQEPQLS
ncbi:UNKNOWN [Stylonychia lemnae]|uniref:Transmembrane protein n=1 Tax=Stylonychia lemnae TaxID=5949 RepID=A0A078ARM4_STYLE|nr:UNKNOWN [Stylonychia lemnae]|eukprot:CDW84854.1 UNKNOWN [Stylonychia lemnae]